MHSLELRVPPLAVVAAAAFVMWLLAAFFPGLRLDFDHRVLAAQMLALAGALMCVSGLIEFRRARTTPNPMDPRACSALVTRGIYRVSRNPMYAGFTLILLGWSAFLGTPLGLAVIAGFIGYLDRFQIVPEERVLAAKFGTAFDAYRLRVRRWI